MGLLSALAVRQRVSHDVSFPKPGSMHLPAPPLKPTDLCTNTGNTTVIPLLRQLRVCRHWEERQGKQKSAWLGPGNQWVGGQKANAIREPEWSALGACWASIGEQGRERVILCWVPSTCPLHGKHHPASTTKLTSITSRSTSITFSPAVNLLHAHTRQLERSLSPPLLSSQTTAWLYLLITTPETEMDEFHFDFNAVLFECKEKKGMGRAADRIAF